MMMHMGASKFAASQPSGSSPRLANLSEQTAPPCA
jgi:hypothetical protein